jgi:hypothetical protein
VGPAGTAVWTLPASRSIQPTSRLTERIASQQLPPSASAAKLLSDSSCPALPCPALLVHSAAALYAGWRAQREGQQR